MSKPPPKQKNNLRPEWIVLPFLALITWLVYSPIPGNGFINWDDPSLILNNPAIRSLDPASVARLFTTSFLGNYHPLTMVSYAVEYTLFGASPAGYHVVSLLLHMANTLLVFVLFFRIFGKKTFPALVVALLFSVHPMHLESVAWASERKDLLFSLFYLLSLILYLRSSDSPTKRSLFYFSLITFLFSLLSKPQAVTLPLVLLLLDYLRDGRFGWRPLLTKWPFFALSLLFGVVAILSQHGSSGINEAQVPAAHYPFLNAWAYLVYYFRAVVPLGLAGHHEYPYTAAGTLPLQVLLSPALILLMAGLVWKFLRRDRIVVFGLLFFTVSVLPMLLLPVGRGYMEDRFSYLAYLGFFMIPAARLPDLPLQGRKLSTGSKVLTGAVLFLIIVFSVQTYSRTSVWTDSGRFWKDVQKRYPGSQLAREHLSMYYYFETDSLGMAIRQMEEAVQADSSYSAGYRLLGFYLLENRDYSAALGWVNRGLRLDPRNGDLWLYRGHCHKALGQADSALSDYSRGIALDPGRSDLRISRGALYSDILADYPRAIEDFRQAWQIDPADGTSCLNLSISAFKGNEPDTAIVWAGKAVDRNQPYGYLVKALALRQKGDLAEAAHFARLARNANIPVPDSLLTQK